MGGFFWEDFLKGFFGRIFFGRNSLFVFLKSANLFEYLNLKGIDAFVKILSQRRRKRKDKNLDP